MSDLALLAPAPPPGQQPGPRPRFAVVIAAYQAADTIEAAVRSVLDQTEPPEEIVVCNDGSTDDTAERLVQFGDAVRYFPIAHAGEPAAKNAGTAATTAPWVVVLDADDVWLPTRLERLADLGAARPDLDVLSTDAWFLVEGVRRGRFHAGPHEFPVERQATELLRRDWVFAGAAVRRSAFDRVGGYCEEVAYAADWHLWLRLVLSGSVAGCVDEPLVEYVIHGASLSASRAASLSARVDVLDRVAEQFALDEEQATALRQTRASSLRRARVAGLETALVTGQDVRRAALALARTPGIGRHQRSQAITACCAPRVASAVLRRRVADGGALTSARSLPTSDV